MRMKPIAPAARGIARWIVLLAALAGLAPATHAVIKEPENLVWGNVLVGGKLVTAAQTDIVVEARRSLSGPTLASYRMGSSAAAGNFYSLAIPLESVKPIQNQKATTTGETVLILVHNGQFVRYLTLYTVGGRGQITRLDLGDVDTDNNGLVDNWERQYFGASGQNPNGDPDRDGVGNRDEMLAGTHPLFPDSRHPADVSPTNNVITIHEVARYALAWKTGQSWPVAPTNIPVEFVARAGYLWKNGESYKLDTNYLSAGAPLWWTNVPPQVGPNATVQNQNAESSSADKKLGLASAAINTSKVIRTIAKGASARDPLAVTLAVRPAASVSAYGIEETIPQGWTVASISDDGAFDIASRRVRWGLFFDRAERRLTYRLLPEAGVGGEASLRLSGLGSFDGWNVPTQGDGAAPEPVPLQMRPPQLLADGRVVFTFSGEPGARYDVQISNDLRAWTTIATVTAGANGKVEFIDDTTPVEAGRRFFRAQRAAATSGAKAQ